MNEIEIELIQAAICPGDTLVGLVSIQGTGDPQVQLTFQGEEILSANSMAFNYVLPFFERSITLDCSNGPQEFRIQLPPGSPPTYFSQDLRCLYVLKARRKGAAPGLIPGFRRDAIHRINVPVLPAPVETAPQQHWFSLESEGLTLEVRLDSTYVEAGQSMTGELLLKRAEGNQTPLPRLLSFRFAAIEESTQEGYFHRKVTSLQTHDIHPDEEFEFPLRGMFEFPIERDAPTSGDWHSFRVHYGFRVGMTLADGRQVRESLAIAVSRYPEMDPETPVTFGFNPSPAV